MIFMKKIIPVLAVLGSAVAFAVYKMKKDEQKQLIDLDEGLLKDEDPCSCEKPIIHEPLQQAKEEATAPVEVEPKAEPEAVCEETCQCSSQAEAGNEEYPHLTNSIVEDIHTMTKNAIASLAKDGDIHEHERPIQHMVAFKNQADYDTFKSTVINKGFVITKGEGDFELIVLHISPIDEHKLIQNILYLADQAYANHGEYHGWQSKVSF